MFYFGVITITLSGLCLGFGVAVFRLTKAVSIWNIRFAPRKKRRLLRIASVVLLLFGIALLLLSVDLICGLWVGESFICIAVCIGLMAIFSAVGIVCGDFAATGFREFSQESFYLLGETEIIKKSEQKLRQYFGAVIGLDAIAFIGKDGSVLEVLWFKDFELTELKSSIQTDILRQYLKRKELSKEIHSLSSKLAVALKIGG